MQDDLPLYKRTMSLQNLRSKNSPTKIGQVPNHSSSYVLTKHREKKMLYGNNEQENHFNMYITNIINRINHRRYFSYFHDQKGVNFLKVLSSVNRNQKFVRYIIKKEIQENDSQTIFREDNIIINNILKDYRINIISFMNTCIDYSKSQKNILKCSLCLVDGIIKNLYQLPTDIILILQTIIELTDRKNLNGKNYMLIFLFLRIVVPVLVNPENLTSQDKNKQIINVGKFILKFQSCRLDNNFETISQNYSEKQIRKLNNKMEILETSIKTSNVNNFHNNYKLDPVSLNNFLIVLKKDIRNDKIIIKKKYKSPFLMDINSLLKLNTILNI